MSTGFTHESNAPATPEWYTPPEIFEGLGTFDVDVASPGAAVVPWVPARRHVTKEENGLDMKHWVGRVWCNPPYGRDIGKWVERCVAHGNGMLLVFNRTDTEWGQLALRKCSAALFLRKRVRFLRPDGTRGDSPGTGSILFAFGGGLNDTALVRCGVGGEVMEP